MTGKPNGKDHQTPPPQAMLNLRVLKALSVFASKDETRYYLQGVCIEVEERGSTYIGTDGHRLITYRDDLAPDDDDNTLAGVFIVPTPHCKHFKLDKEDDGRAILYGADAGRITIAHGFTDITFMPIDGVYPHWRKSLPQGTPSGKLAQFNVTLLADLRKLTKQLGLSEPFIAHNGDNPAFIWFSGHPQVFGVMMPQKAIDELNREPPQWVRRGPKREQGDVEDEKPLFTEEFDPETGELPPEKPAEQPPEPTPGSAADVVDRAMKAAANPGAVTDPKVRAAIKKFGTPVDLTDDEKAKGYSAAFIGKDGTRMAWGLRPATKACAARTDVIRSPIIDFGAACREASVDRDGAGPGETPACRGAEPNLAAHTSVHERPAGQTPGASRSHKADLRLRDHSTSPAHMIEHGTPTAIAPVRTKIASEPPGPDANAGLTAPGRAALLTPRPIWRWKKRRQIVRGLAAGQFTVDDVVSKCRLAAAELAEWRDRYARLGNEGLKYRRPPTAYPRGEARAA